MGHISNRRKLSSICTALHYVYRYVHQGYRSFRENDSLIELFTSAQAKMHEEKPGKKDGQQIEDIIKVRAEKTRNKNWCKSYALQHSSHYTNCPI